MSHGARILSDAYVDDLFYDKQWEFCAPIFMRGIMPRVLESPAILPFINDVFLDKEGYGFARKIMIHPRHC